MKARFFVLVSAIALVFCSGALAAWTTPEAVNAPRAGDQLARGGEPGWAICVDDSLLIQVVWEDLSGVLLDIAEVHYRAKPLRGNWGTDKNVTGDDNTSTNPGHPSVTTYKISSAYKTLVAYASQNAYNSEYKGRIFHRNEPAWDVGFEYISEEGGLHLLGWGGGQSGGRKTGSVVDNGDNKTFAVWPYHDPIDNVAYLRLWYNIRDENGWAGEARILDADLAYWAQDVCPYPDPNNNIHLVYSYSADDESYDVYWVTYDFGSAEFSTPTQVSDVTQGVKAVAPYVVCVDKGAGDYLLHFVWQEIQGGLNRVLYRRYDSETQSFSDQVTIVPYFGSLPCIAATPDGDVYVAWENRSSNPHVISWKKASPPGYSWSNASSLSLPDGIDSLMAPVMVKDFVGNLHMAVAGWNSNPEYCLDDVHCWDVLYTFNELPPVSPQNVADLQDKDHPMFKWSPCKEPNFRHYHIYRTRDPRNGWSLAASQTDTIFTDYMTFLDPDDRDIMYYHIKAEDQLDQESLPSVQLEYHYGIYVGPKVVGELLPVDYSLSQNYPNPFNAETCIEYALPSESHVVLQIYDMLGRKVNTLIDEKQLPGYYRTIWRPDDVPSGIYLLRLQAGEFVECRKVTLLK